MTTFVFGEWDAPLTFGAQRLTAPPEDMTCMYCQESFKPADNGAVLSHGPAIHRECSMRVAFGGIGHLVNHKRYCEGPLGTDAGLTQRQSSWLVWRHVVDGDAVTEEELDTLYEIEQHYYRSEP